MAVSPEQFICSYEVTTLLQKFYFKISKVLLNTNYTEIMIINDTKLFTPWLCISITFSYSINTKVVDTGHYNVFQWNSEK